jgi:integrase
MVNRTQLLDPTFLATAPDGTYSEPGNIEGCALEIRVQKGGKSKRACFRYNGRLFNEPRTTRLKLGSYDLGLYQLRRMRADCERLIEQGKSPRAYQKRQEEQKLAASMTFRQAFEEYRKHATEVIWNSDTARDLAGIMKNHLYPLPLMDMPIDVIRAAHLSDMIGEKWRTMNGIGAKLRSLIHSTLQFQIDKDDGIYRGPNPASWRRTSSLSRKLGKRAPDKRHAGINYEDVPKVMAYFSSPQDHWVPGYVTTMQAAAAWEIDPQAIRRARYRGQITGVIKAPPIWKGHANLNPVAELIKLFGQPIHDPEPGERVDAAMYSRMARFLILTPVREHMAIELRWRHLTNKHGIDVIEYLPERKDRTTGKMLASEHKLGWDYNVPYIVIYTENLRAIVEAQRQQNIKDGIRMEPDDFVFVHGKPRFGYGKWTGNVSEKAAIWDYLRKAVARIVAQGIEVKLVPENATHPTVHGLRSTFATWAKEEHGYDDDLINLSLGHVIPAIRENRTNEHYLLNVQLLKRRAEMMTRWEQHCLSLVLPQQEVNSSNACINGKPGANRAASGQHPADLTGDRPLRRNGLRLAR